MAAVQLTTAGAALVAAGNLPIILGSYKLGSGVNYIPSPADTDIHGTLVFNGAPSAPVVVSANMYKYSVFLDYPTGPFQFGELGLFTGTGVLFALAAWNTLLTKEQLTSSATGNAIRVDIYLSIVAANYSMWLDLAQTDNQFRFPVLSSVDLLPASQNAIPNAYVISGISNNQSSFLAYTDQNAFWNFDAYTFSSQVSATVLSAASFSVTIPLGQYVTAMTPVYFGQVVLEFRTGNLYSVCRYVKSVTLTATTAQLIFANPIAVLPVAGDIFDIFVRQSTTIATSIPTASHTQLGGVIVGQSLTVDDTSGLIDVDYTKIPYPVLSVNGKTGVVVLTATDITGFAAVATSGSYLDLFNKPAAYTLPVATTATLGGVRAPTTGNITISAAGVIDLGVSSLVSSVNGKTGAVILVATDITGFAAVATSGSYLDLSNKPTIPAAYVLPAATAAALGGVMVSATSGLGVDGPGNLTLKPPTGVVLGGVKAGANITIAADGTISATASGVTSVDGQTGAVVVKAVDNNAATGSSVIFDSGATTGTIKLRTIAGGLGTFVGNDTNGNVVVNASAATTTALGAVIVGSGLSVDGSGNLTLAAPTGGNIGGVKAGTNISIAGDGTISSTGGVTSFNTRVGVVTLQSSDLIDGSSNFILTSPSITGIPVADTAAPGTNTRQLATTAFVTAAVTATTAGVTSFNTRTGAVTLQSSDLVTIPGNFIVDSPKFTGSASITTSPTAGDSSTLIADTSFVTSAISTAVGLLAPINSPTFTGTPSLTTTPTAGDNTTKLASTAFVTAAVAAVAAGVSSFNTRTGAVVLLAADVTGVGGALVGAANTFTGANSFTSGTITVPTQTATDSSTNAASTAFVHAVVSAGVVTGVPANGNGFIDGALEQWNVNTTFTLAAAVTQYTADMWMNYSGASGAATVTRQAYTSGQNTAGSVEPPKYYMQHSQTTAATDNPFIQQKLESARKYAGQSATFSVCLTGGAALTVVGVNVVQNFGTGGSPSATVTTNVPVTWAVTTTEQRFSVRLDIPSVNGKTFGTQFTDTLSIQLVLPTGQTFVLSAGQFQIEPSSATSSSNTTGTGGSPSAFNYLGYAQEQVRTRRYVAYFTATGVISLGIAASTAFAYGPSQKFPVTMLKVPTITVTGVQYQDAASPSGTGSATGVTSNTEEYYLQMNASGRTTWAPGYFSAPTLGTFLFDARP